MNESGLETQEQREYLYYLARDDLTQLFGDKIPQDFNEFVLWLDGVVLTL